MYVRCIFHSIELWSSVKPSQTDAYEMFASWLVKINNIKREEEGKIQFQKIASIRKYSFRSLSLLQ